MSWWTTFNLGSEEIRKYLQNLKKFKNCGLVPSLPPKMKVSSMLAKKSLKVEIKLFKQCIILDEN